MRTKYLNAVGDSLALTEVLPPDSECQPIGEDTPPYPPAGAPQCPPCNCNAKSVWPWFWIFVAAVTVGSYIMGGEEKSLTGGTL